MSIHVYSDVNVLMDTSLLRDAGQTYTNVWMEIKHVHKNFKVPQQAGSQFPLNCLLIRSVYFLP